jgi:hypothetical protein
VTEILSVYQDWSKISEETLKAAAARGTKVHDLCFAHIKKVFTFSTSGNHYAYFQSFKLWFDEYVDEVVLAEEHLYDDTYRFSGRPDLVAVLRGESAPIVIDYKTPVTEGKTWCLQLAGYLKLAESYETTRGMALMLDPKGKIARAKPYESDQDTAVFLQMVGIHHYLRR